MKHPYLAKLLFLLLFAAFGFPSGAYAQTGTISGRVTDSKNEGIPGATVLIEGSSLGSSSNVDGTYSIQNVPAGPQTVVISFVGYNSVRRPVTVTAGQNTEVAASLTENATQLSEAVVVGYGTQRRQDVTGSVATVDSRQFVQGQVTNPEQLIQGKVAGVSITTGGGAPGAGNVIRIRGNSSLNANNDPLYVIDGVPVDKDAISGASNPLSLINPNDIETFTVLKDASATAIYGNRASGGVILITTKRGLQGEKLRVEVNSQTGVSTVARRYETLSAGAFRSLIQANGSPSQIASLGTANTDWQDQIFRTAGVYDNTISLTGNAAKIPFRVSYGNLYQEGIVITNKLKRNSGSVSLSPTILDGHLRIDINAKGSVVDNRFVDYGYVAGAALYDPTQPVRSNEARYSRYGGYFQFVNPSNGFPLGNAPTNPVAALNNSNNTSTVKRLIGNVQLDYKIHGVEGLRANVNLGIDAARGRGNNVIQPTDFGNYNTRSADPGVSGRYTQYSQDKDMKLLEAYLAYGKQFGGTKFDVQVGHAYQSFVNEGPNFLDYRFNRDTLVNRTDVLTAAGYYGKNVLLSYFGRTTVNVEDKYLLTATLRNDQTSRFRKGYRSGWFPAVGLAWRVKNEDFLKDNAFFSELKVRAGYGRTGQQDIGGAYDTQPRYVISSSTTQYPLGTAPTGITYSPQGYNSVLTWETTNTYNAGLDLGFFDDRLTATLDVYQRTASDLLALVNQSAGSNLTNQLNANIGSLRNRGIELGLNYGVLRGEDLNWNVNLNGAYNVNKITDLGRQAEGFVGYATGGIGGGTGNNIQIQSVGQPSNAFFVRQQVYGPDGRPVQGVYVDRNNDGSISDADNYYYKQPAPLVTLGFSSNVVYKKATFAFTLRGNVGNYVYNTNAANLGTYANAQGSTNFVNNLNPDILNTGFTRPQIFSDYYVQNASFLRCENITLGYNVGKVLGASTLRITGNVQNAFLITKYDGVDPEVATAPTTTAGPTYGIDTNFYPRARTYTLGLALGF
ncbi:MAG TPA: SusC/RagA family TonB-linked outer membrane protein [Hymenobacter sp.]|jgi:iron complex outermembrane receptor protein|uniref:SusC/RagA family TonB-linked outer membrane protein n=1 Tax=Hymenobacter sp. TaxID=1898978 RepID=UPI002ED797A5